MKGIKLAFLAGGLVIFIVIGLFIFRSSKTTDSLKSSELSGKDLTTKTVAIIETEPNFAINGSYYELEAGLLIKPMMKGNSSADNMMVPLRDIFERLPANYSYDKTTGIITMDINGKVLTMTVGSKEAKYDVNPVTAPYAPEVIANPGEVGSAVSSVYLPIKFVFETLGCSVSWDSKQKRLTTSVLLTPRVGVEGLATGGDWQYSSLLTKSTTQINSAKGKIVADNIVEYQNIDGGWMKLDGKVDMTKSIKSNTMLLSSTIDNDATVTELRYLSRAYKATGDKKYAESFVKGTKYIIEGQYENGGWAQYFPNGVGYFKNITINDNAMTNVIELLMDIINKKEAEFISTEYPELLPQIQESFDKGVKCILDLQVVTKGVKTAWAAQYDKDTMKPCMGRAYELPSIATAESVKVVDFLMKIQNPSKEIIESVNSAVAWLDRVKIKGKRMVNKADPSLEFGFDRVVVDDPNSNTWARFVEIETNLPIFSGRDSVKKYNLAEISYERRAKYSWYNTSPEQLINTRYPNWLK